MFVNHSLTLRTFAYNFHGTSREAPWSMYLFTYHFRLHLCNLIDFSTILVVVILLIKRIENPSFLVNFAAESRWWAIFPFQSSNRPISTASSTNLYTLYQSSMQIEIWKEWSSRRKDVLSFQRWIHDHILMTLASGTGAKRTNAYHMSLSSWLVRDRSLFVYDTNTISRSTTRRFFNYSPSSKSQSDMWADWMVCAQDSLIWGCVTSVEHHNMILLINESSNLMLYANSICHWSTSSIRPNYTTWYLMKGMSYTDDAKRYNRHASSIIWWLSKVIHHCDAALFGSSHFIRWRILSSTWTQ